MWVCESVWVWFWSDGNDLWIYSSAWLLCYRPVHTHRTYTRRYPQMHIYSHINTYGTYSYTHTHFVKDSRNIFQMTRTTFCEPWRYVHLACKFSMTRQKSSELYITVWSLLSTAPSRCMISVGRELAYDKMLANVSTLLVEQVLLNLVLIFFL